MAKQMKQFEKLWENNHPIYDTGSDTIGHYNIAKEYWKAALELIKNVGERAFGPEHNCYYEMMDVIDEELKNGNTNEIM